jgi:EAL domain-containing protein (putative c-di-GMP-specific phosphodiesterase class I)
MRRLRNLGVKVHLDDFGTGYSSLAYLQQFAIDTLKIDRGFISRVESNGEGGEIVQTIVTLAHSLGMEALAEGIESTDQLAFVSDLGCSFAQGFLYSKPLPAGELSYLLKRGPMTVA